MLGVELREEYGALTSDELPVKANEPGFGFEKCGYGCSQSTVAAARKLVYLDNVVVRGVTSLSGEAAE
jgi:hypothetical protein